MAIKKIKLPDNTTVDINDSRLPAVTTTDNGKVLSVSGGIWSANSKPSYTLDDVADGSTRSLANYLPLSAGSGNALTDALYSQGIINLGGTVSAIRTRGLEGAGIDGTQGDLFVNYRHAGNVYINGGTVSGSVVIGQTNYTGSAKLLISGDGADILSLNRTTGSYTWIDFLLNGTHKGHIGFGSDGKPYVNTDDVHEIYHSGNSNKSDVAWACSTLTADGAVSATSFGTQGGASYSSASIEFKPSSSASHGGFIDFHYNGSSADYTSRIIESASGRITINNLLSVTNGGNVGVASDTPSQKLYVAGNILATGTITPGSDSRIKDNQKDISSENAFSIIENLKPKTWVWNEKSNEKLNGKSAAGLVAQEVKYVLPEAVTISENGDIKDFHSLNYNTIQGYEIAAIKGLIEEVKSLKAEIVELKKQIK